MLHKRRLSLTVLVTIIVELINKISPLIILHVAQPRLGLKAFGVAQISITWIEMALPLVMFGYNNYGSVTAGQSDRSPQSLGRIMSQVLAMKSLHAGLAFFLLMFAAWRLPRYESLRDLAPIVGLIFLSAALECQWLHVATQRVAHASVIGGVARLITLGLMLWLVQGPDNRDLYVALSLAANVAIGIGTFIASIRRYPLRAPSWPDMRLIFWSSLAFAALAWLGTLVDRVDLLIAENIFGVEGAGLYAGPLRVAQSLAQILLAIVVTFMAEMVILKDAQSVSKHLEWAVWALLALIAPAAVGVWFVDQGLLTLILGPAFGSMGPVLSVMTLSLLGWMFTAIFGLCILQVRGRVWTLAGHMALGLLVALVLGWFLGTSKLGFVGVALGSLAGKGLTAVLVVRSARPYFEGLPWARMVRVMIPAALMGLTLIALPPLRTLPTLVVGVIAYSAAFSWTNRDTLRGVMARIL